MGYRSDVAIVVRKNNYEDMLKSIDEKFKGEERGTVRDFLEQAVKDAPQCYDEEYLCLYWEDVKWYYDFAEVKFIEDYLKTIKDFDCIKIGEELDDVTCTFNTGKFLINLDRRISFG